MPWKVKDIKNYNKNSRFTKKTLKQSVLILMVALLIFKKTKKIVILRKYQWKFIIFNQDNHLIWELFKRFKLIALSILSRMKIRLTKKMIKIA